MVIRGLGNEFNDRGWKKGRLKNKEPFWKCKNLQKGSLVNWIYSLMIS